MFSLKLMRRVALHRINGRKGLKDLNQGSLRTDLFILYFLNLFHIFRNFGSKYFRDGRIIWR